MAGFKMRYAIINNINVVNVIDYNEQPTNPPPGFEEPIIAVQSDEAQIGWTYVDNQFIAPAQPAPTPEELIQKCKEIATGILSFTDWTISSALIEYSGWRSLNFIISSRVSCIPSESPVRSAI